MLRGVLLLGKLYPSSLSCCVYCINHGNPLSAQTSYTEGAQTSQDADGTTEAIRLGSFGSVCVCMCACTPCVARGFQFVTVGVSIFFLLFFLVYRTRRFRCSKSHRLIAKALHLTAGGCLVRKTRWRDCKRS